MYYKDRATSMYSPMPYLEATTVAELPYLVIQAVVMVSITYWMVVSRAEADALALLLVPARTCYCLRAQPAHEY